MLTNPLWSSVPQPDSYNTKAMWAAALVAHNPSFTVKDFQQMADHFGLDPTNTALWYTAVKNWRKANGLGPYPRSHKKGHPRAANWQNPHGELSWKKGERKRQREARKQQQQQQQPKAAVPAHPLGCTGAAPAPSSSPKPLPASLVSKEVVEKVTELQRWMRSKGIATLEIDAAGEVRLSNPPKSPKGPSFVIKSK